MTLVRSPLAAAGPLARVLAAWALMTVSACESDDPVEPPEPVPPPVWSEVADLPPAFTFYGLWVPTPDYVVAVGPRGLIARWDGQSWATIDNESGQDFYGITGATGGPIVAVGNTGHIVRFVTNRFLIADTPTTENLRGVWMASADDFFVVGDGGTILRGDGVVWWPQPSHITLALFSVWGASGGDVFAVGMDGTILRFDGTAWNAMESGTTEILSSVSGTSFSDVYAAGANGTILHFDGIAWSPMESGTTDVLQSVWAPGGPIAAGANGTILRLDQGAWTRESGVTGRWLYGVARSGGHIWLVGTNAIHMYDGASWTMPTRGAVPALRAGAGVSSSDIVVGGDEGYIACGWSGNWRVEDTGTARRINALWRSSSDELFAVGTNRIMRHDGTQWVVESSELGEFHDIGGAGSSIFAVGSESRIRRRVSGSWVVSANLGPLSLHAISVASEREAFAAGENGFVLHLTGGQWRSMSTRTQADLHDIIATRGDEHRAIAVGEGGAILMLTTSAVGWVPMTSPTTAPLYALARGPGGDLYAVGGAGTVLRLVDARWVKVTAPTGRTVLDAWNRGETLFLSGGDTVNGGVLFRFGRPP